MMFYFSITDKKQDRVPNTQHSAVGHRTYAVVCGLGTEPWLSGGVACCLGDSRARVWSTERERRSAN